MQDKEISVNAIVTPAYNGTARGRFFPMQAGFVSYRYFNFGSSGMYEFSAKTDFRYAQVPCTTGSIVLTLILQLSWNKRNYLHSMRDVPSQYGSYSNSFRCGNTKQEVFKGMSTSILWAMKTSAAFPALHVTTVIFSPMPTVNDSHL